MTDGAGTPLEDIEVLLYRWTEGSWEPYNDTYTRDNGFYAMGGIEPGRYRMGFSSYGDYLTEYWDDASTLAAATDIDVAADQKVSHVDAALATTATPAIASVEAPAVTGDARVGAPLIASPGTWAPNTGLSYSYQWVVGGEDVAGATAPTYVPGNADIGKAVRVRVRVSRLGYTPGTSLSAASAPVAAVVPTLTNVVVPSIDRSTVGVTAHATSGAWSPTHQAAGYQWLVDGSPVAGATTSSYVPVPADAGKKLQVRVTATAPGHTSGTATSAAVTVGKGVLTVTRKPTVTGTAKRNATLTASPGRWSPARVKVAYQWFAGAKAIPKATATKLRLAGKTLKAAKGKAITILLTVTAPGYTTVTTRLKVPGRV